MTRRKTAVWSFSSALSRTRAVLPSESGVSDQFSKIPPTVKFACSVLPSRSVFARPFRVPVSSQSIVVSVESITNVVATLPHGTSGMIPTQVPAKRLSFTAGCSFTACCLTERVADALDSDFASGFGLGLSDGFGFGLADCSGAGVGLSISEIGAGRRCAITKSDAATSVQPSVRRAAAITMA